jgi:membrane protease YdiL (CAAX protease family)
MLSKKPWRTEVVLFFCAAQASCLFLGVVLIGILQKMKVNGFHSDEDFGNPLVATLSFQGATWLLIPIFLRLHGTSFRDAFGLRKGNWLAALLLAIFVVMIILPVSEVLMQVSVHILDHFGWKEHDEEAVTLVTGAKAFWMKVYLDVFTVVLAPVAEEFIFRGGLYKFIKQLGFPWLAFFGVSALFALIHGDAAIAAPLFLLALALTMLYEITDNLLAPIGAHSLFNATNLLVLYFSEPLEQLLQKIHVHLT